MIDNELEVFNTLNEGLKEVFNDITLTDQKLRFYDSTYPAVSLIQTNNYILQESRTFNNYGIHIEEYELETQSDNSMTEIKDIMYKIDEIMIQLGYIRTYSGLDTQDQETKLKRLMQYTTAL